jgi:hypothetical protein
LIMQGVIKGEACENIVDARLNWNLELFVFMEGVTEEPGEKPLKHRRERTTNSTPISPELGNWTWWEGSDGPYVSNITSSIFPLMLFYCHGVAK